MPGFTSTCLDTSITSNIFSRHQPTSEPIISITVPIRYHVDQAKNHQGGICQSVNIIDKGPHSCPCNIYSDKRCKG